MELQLGYNQNHSVQSRRIEMMICVRVSVLRMIQGVGEGGRENGERAMPTHRKRTLPKTG